MSRRMDTRRLRRLAIAGGAAALTLLAGAVMEWREAGESTRPQAEGPVLAQWDERLGQVEQITIRSAETLVAIRRTPNGWVAPDRANHPVNMETLAALDALMGGLDYVGARTRDRAKHERLGLGAPEEGGSGLQVTAYTAGGERVADILLGAQNGGEIYVRTPGESQSWAARLPQGLAERPSVADMADWIDLDFLALEEIARTTITPESGPAYRLERASPGSRNFALRDPPGWTPITAGAGNGPGGALTRIRLRDVRPSAELDGAPVAEHAAEAFSGLAVRLVVFADGESRWAVIRAEARTDDAEAAARALNARTEGWAYLLSDLSVDRLLRPLPEIADPRPGPDDAP